MLRPRMARTAGRNVVARRTATPTTNSPPTPTERVSESGVVTSAANPTTTVSPNVTTSKPAGTTPPSASQKATTPELDTYSNKRTTQAAACAKNSLHSDRAHE